MSFECCLSAHVPMPDNDVVPELNRDGEIDAPIPH